MLIRNREVDTRTLEHVLNELTLINITPVLTVLIGSPSHLLTSRSEGQFSVMTRQRLILELLLVISLNLFHQSQVSGVSVSSVVVSYLLMSGAVRGTWTQIWQEAPLNTWLLIILARLVWWGLVRETMTAGMPR